MLRSFFVGRSTQAWKTKFFVSSLDSPFLLSQQFPCSAGGRLLDAGYLDKLHDADKWESFRLCLGVGSKVKSRPCILCRGPVVGHAHLLAVCPAVLQQRESFVASSSVFFADRLATAPPGDWPSVLLSPHMDLDRLALVVSFCAQIMDALGACENNICAPSCVCGLCIGVAVMVGARRGAAPFRGPAHRT